MENLRISYSSLGVASTCLRKFELNKLYQHPARKFESIAMSAGTALHAGYQNYLVHRDLDKALWELSLVYPHIHCWDEFDDRSWEACMATLVAMIEFGNHSEWDIAYIKNDLGEEVPAIEVPFEIELRGLTLADGRGISYVGFIDAIMERFRGKHYRTMDIKTHRSYMKDRTANFIFDTQQIPYGIVLEHALGKPIEEFEVDYLDCFLDILAPRVVPHTYKKTQESVSEWLISTMRQVDTITHFHKLGMFPRADHGCTFYNKPCKFLDICQVRNREDMQKLLLLDGPAAEEQEWKPWIKCFIDVTEIGV